MNSKLIPAKAARERCGDKSNMTLHRWLNDEKMAFPRPVYISGRRYFLESEIEAFIVRQREAGPSFPTAQPVALVKSAA